MSFDSLRAVISLPMLPLVLPLDDLDCESFCPLTEGASFWVPGDAVFSISITTTSSRSLLLLLCDLFCLFFLIDLYSCFIFISRSPFHSGIGPLSYKQS